MPEQVVHLLETIQIEAEQRHGALATPRALERQLELLCELAPVRKLRQLVGRGEHRQLAIRLLESPLDVLQVRDLDDRLADSTPAFRPVDRVEADEVVRRPVLARELQVRDRFTGLEHRSQERLERIRVVWDELAQRLADELVGRHAEDGGQRLVHPDVPQLLVEERKSGRR